MRYRDLETGTFLTRDPLGYKDGPNVYCYVHCNPITHFDAWGLITIYIVDSEDKGAPGRATGAKMVASVDEAIKQNGGIRINASTLRSAISQVHDKVVNENTVIDKLVIVDHGQKRMLDPDGYTHLQNLGNGRGEEINPRNLNDQILYNELTQYVEPEGTVVHAGCETGKDEKAVQDYANISNRRTEAMTWQPQTVWKTGDTETPIPIGSVGDVDKDSQRKSGSYPESVTDGIKVDHLKEQEKRIEQIREDRNARLNSTASE